MRLCTMQPILLASADSSSWNGRLVLTNTAPTLRAKHAAALPGAAHFKESKHEAVGQPCAMHGCSLNRNIGYQQFCTKHGRESGFLLKRMMCRADDCDHRAILASVGYCAKDVRELGIKIPKYHCSESDRLNTPRKYGGLCRNCSLRAA